MLWRGALTEAILALLDDPSRLPEWQDASWWLRPERSWAKYRTEIRRLLTTLCS